MKLKFITLLLLLMIFTQIVWAKDIGTTMFQILQLPTNAYDAALANTTTSDELSALSNPVFIPFLSRSINLTHVMFLENMKYSVGNVNLPISDKSGINFGFCYFDSGKINRTIESGDSYITDGDFNTTDKMFSLSYGRLIGNSFSFGAIVKFIEQTIDDTSYSSFLVGLDGLYFLSNNVFCTLGIDNFGSDVKGYSVPTNIYCGLTANMNETTKGVVQLDNYYNESLCELKIALEKKIDNVAMRFGYIFPTKDYDGTNNSFASNVTLGLGLDFKIIVIDYAWLPKGDLGNVHVFTVRVNF